MRTISIRLGAYVLATGALATVIAAPRLFLPAALSRDGRLGAALILGALQCAVLAACLAATLALPDRWTRALRILCIAAFVIAAGVLAVWSDDAAFLVVAAACRFAGACGASELPDRVLHAINMAAHPSLPWTLLPAAALAMAARPRAGRPLS